MDKLIVITGLFIFALLGLFLVDVAASTTKTFYGVVVDKNHTEKRSSSAYGIDSEGKSIYYVDHSPASYELTIEGSAGLTTVECKKEVYYKKSVGDSTKYKVLYGYFTKSVYRSYAVN